MLNVENLCVNYGAIKAVRNVSFHVEKGEIVSIIGNNGAGKSSTLRALTGIVKPASGSIRLFDQEIAQTKAHKICNMGMAMCPEGRGIYTRMTVEENLEMGAYNRKDKDGVKNDFEKVYQLFPVLAERRKQKGGSLSGGEQQMLAMARALMSKPRLLMLDEPSMGLAPILVEQIFDIIRALHKSGTTILLVEQNAQMALSVANRAYVLETGKISMSGDAQELLHNDAVRKAYLGA